MLHLQALGEDPSWLITFLVAPSIPWLMAHHSVSPSVFTQPSSFVSVSFHPVVRIFSLDVGPNLICYDLISILA